MTEKKRKSPITYSTFEELKAKAADMELKGVNFLTRKGELAKKRQAVHHTQFIFIDGVELFIPKPEMNKPGFGQLVFSLRPVKDNG